jgi:hypothetical protein
MIIEGKTIEGPWSYTIYSWEFANQSLMDLFGPERVTVSEPFKEVSH